MRHKFLVLTAKNGQNRCTFAEVIAKLKQGYRFFGPPGILLELLFTCCAIVCVM